MVVLMEPQNLLSVQPQVPLKNKNSHLIQQDTLVRLQDDEESNICLFVNTFILNTFHVNY